MSEIIGLDKIGKIKEINICGIMIFQFVADIIDSNMYVILAGENAIVFDAVCNGDLYNFLEIHGVKHADVFITHEHFDHIYGLNHLRDKIDCTVYAGEAVAVKMENPSKNLSNKVDIFLMFNKDYLWVDSFKPFSAVADRIINDREVSVMYGHTVEVFLTEGHTKGGMSYLVDGKILVTGDTLMGLPTITRFPSGSKKVFLEKTLPFYESIKDRVEKVLPGHGDCGNIDEMIECNMKFLYKE